VRKPQTIGPSQLHFTTRIANRDTSQGPSPLR
jgi:hypothetical protein